MALRKIRDANVRSWSGVCAGIAYSLGCSTGMIRFLFVFSTFFLFPFNFFAYWILAIVLPTWPETPPDYYNTCE